MDEQPALTPSAAVRDTTSEDPQYRPRRSAEAVGAPR